MKNSKYEHLKIIYNRSKLGWYWSPLFIAFWVLLFYLIVLESYHYLPTTLKIQDEAAHPGQFIGENAENLLLKLTKIGPKVVGSPANEQGAVHWLLDEIGRIRKSARSDLYKIEHEVQIATGNYAIFEMINAYQSIQNVVVKITPRNGTSNKSLLINTHYDTVPGSPGAGDAGFMVAIMLETLRVISKYETELRHPIVFLFNGAEESPLQGSHAFITQHKWAKDIGAFINLDSAGSGGKETLFQTGPNHPWLVKYYAKNCLHYMATTIAEELFQSGFVPSDTDFRIFRDFGHVPGLDMASVLNGYVYHTKYDRFNAIPRNSYQSTGDNVLALAKALANAPELDNSTQHAEGHIVFYDVLGWFFVYYTETTGTIINIVVCVLALITILAYIWNMAHQTGMFRRRIFAKFGILFGIQCGAVTLALLVTISIAFLLDLMGLSLSWYSQKWMIFGLYFCPMFFVLGIIPAIYLTRTKEHGLPLGYAIQLVMHSHCLLLIIAASLMIAFGIRTAFIVVIGIAFYTISVLLNIVTCFHNKNLRIKTQKSYLNRFWAHCLVVIIAASVMLTFGIRLAFVIINGLTVFTLLILFNICMRFRDKPFLWLVPHTVCQLLPFLFYTYNCYSVFESFVPMQARSGGTQNPELIIAAFTALLSLLFSGFLIPLFWLFRKSKLIISCFAAICIAFIILAATPLGFPYVEKTASQRFYVLHTTRTLRNADPEMSVRNVNSGYYVMPMDRRYNTMDTIFEAANFTKEKPKCDVEINCGNPIYSARWLKYNEQGFWVPGPKTNDNGWPKMRILGKQRTSRRKVLYTLEVSGPDHMNLIIRPVKDAKLFDWSFDKKFLEKNNITQYLIHFVYALDPAPLRFNLEFERDSANWTGPSFDLAIIGHKSHHDIFNTEEFRQFLALFPTWAYPSAWTSSFDSWTL